MTWHSAHPPVIPGQQPPPPLPRAQPPRPPIRLGPSLYLFLPPPLPGNRRRWLERRLVGVVSRVRLVEEAVTLQVPPQE